MEQHDTYIDSYGVLEVYAEKVSPDLTLITDMHGDYMNLKTFGNIDISNITILIPQVSSRR
jgi:hypothetical protein